MIYSRAGLDYWGRLLYEAFYFVQQLKGGSDSKPKKFFPTYKPKAAFPPPPISLAGLYRHVLHYPVLADKTDQQFILVDERFKTLLEELEPSPRDATVSFGVAQRNGAVAQYVGLASDVENGLFSEIEPCA